LKWDHYVASGNGRQGWGGGGMFGRKGENFEVSVEVVKDYVQNYTITKDDKTYDVGIKRTYGGDHFKFVDGKCIAYVSLRSDKLENALGELTEEVLKDQETNFTNFFKATDSNACTGESNC
jgi:hypothetical protein